jgi:hypothetical protein
MAIVGAVLGALGLATGVGAVLAATKREALVPSASGRRRRVAADSERTTER